MSQDDIEIFDRKLVRQRRNRSAALWQDHNFLHAEIADRTADRVHDINRQFDRALHMGAHAQGIADCLPNIDFIHTNLSEKRLHALDGSRVVCDDELLAFDDESFDLVISNLSLHSVNDLPGALIQIRRILKPDGLFLASMFGGDTLHEFRQAMMKAELDTLQGSSPRVAPTADVRDMGSLLQRAGFVMPVTDIDTITVSYDNPFKLMHDLRGMGESNVVNKRLKRPTKRSTFMRMAEIYAKDHADADGRIPATFQVIYLSGWSPGPNQPVPKRPGSATKSLAEALGTTEQKTGDKV